MTAMIMALHGAGHGMYEGQGHGSTWWGLYLGSAAVLVVVLMVLMLLGVARGSR